jgi:hypothetical protein
MMDLRKTCWCEHCGVEWELPASEGIEIVEPWENRREWFGIALVGVGVLILGFKK